MSHAYTLKEKKVWNEKYVKHKLILKGTRMEKLSLQEVKKDVKKHTLVYDLFFYLFFYPT